MIITCTNCGYRQIDSNPKCIYGKNWGSPIKYCLKCTHEFYVSDICEAAISPKPVRPKLPIKFFSFEMLGLLLGPIFLVSQLFFSDPIFLFCGIFLSIFSFFAAIVIVVSDKKAAKEYDALLAESKRRIEDQEYANKLKSFTGGTLC